jgi:hypothetical protein
MSVLRAFYRPFDWIFFTKESNGDEEPDSVLMIDTPVCLQFLLVCTLWLGWAYLAKTARKPQRGGVNLDPP